MSNQTQDEQIGQQSITLVVNGETRHFPAPQTLATLSGVAWNSG